MKKSGNKWSTEKCGRCGKPHDNYSGKLDSKGIEYVVCGVMHKRMNVSGRGEEGNSGVFYTKWNLTTGHIEDENWIGTISSNGIVDIWRKKMIVSRMSDIMKTDENGKYIKTQEDIELQARMDKNKPSEDQTCPECGSDWIG